MREFLRPLVSVFGLVSISLGLYAIWRGIGEPDDTAFAIAAGAVALAIRYTFLRHVLVGLSLKITGVPPGEAPAWVREQWVGLTVPLFQASAEPVTIRTGGVVSGPNGVWSSLAALAQGKTEKVTGFLVLAKEAIDLLDVKSPEAARWWRECASHLYRPREIFVFPSDIAFVVGRDFGGSQNDA